MAKVINGITYLDWADLTEAEQAKVIGRGVLADLPEEYNGQYVRLGTEVYITSDEDVWSVTIPNEHEALYPERFAYQDEGCEDSAEFTESVLIPLTCDAVDEALVLAEYIKVKPEHIEDFSYVSFA